MITQQILKQFQPRVDATKSALFKHLLKEACTLQKQTRGGQDVGVWVLKPEFSNV